MGKRKTNNPVTPATAPSGNTQPNVAPETKPDVPLDNQPTEPTVPTPPETKPEPVPKGTIALVKRGATVIREYTRDIHGDNFADLAHEFASNHGGDVEVK